jgi:anti-sigma B factor antagonist
VHLDITDRPVGSSTVVAVSGELDMETAPQLRVHLLNLIREDSREVIIDLTELPFMDSSGLQVLLSSKRRAELFDGTLALCGLQTPVSRVLEITGLIDYFDVYPNADAALALNRS